MSYKGKFKPKNPKKYSGNIETITYRSLWERKFMRYCDLSPKIKSWASEELAIPYLSPIDNKIHRYFPDFIIETAEGTIIMIEIKPLKQTRPPKESPSSTKNWKKRNRLINEAKTYAINTSKWKSAKDYCDKYGWEFKILTEKDLKI